jgi:hypothetical protein
MTSEYNPANNTNVLELGPDSVRGAYGAVETALEIYRERSEKARLIEKELRALSRKLLSTKEGVDEADVALNDARDRAYRALSVGPHVLNLRDGKQEVLRRIRLYGLLRFDETDFEERVGANTESALVALSRLTASIQSATNDKLSIAKYDPEFAPDQVDVEYQVLESVDTASLVFDDDELQMFVEIIGSTEGSMPYEERIEVFKLSGRLRT